MWFLYILSWIALVVQLTFITIGIAAGLYYLAELVEEYTVVAKRVIVWMCLGTLLVYICLMIVEGFPARIVVPGLLSQAAHLYILKSFPCVVLLSPQFITAVLFFFVNHYYAFVYFGETYYSFSEVTAFFTICLWLVPFALFISVSANENTLPTVAFDTSPLLGDENDVVTNYFSRKGKKYGLLSFFNYVKESLPLRNKKTF